MIGSAGEIKDERIKDILLWTSTQGDTSADWAVKISIGRLCADTWYRLEDLQ